MAGLARHVDPEEIIQKLKISDDKAHHHRLRAGDSNGGSSLTPCRDPLVSVIALDLTDLQTRPDTMRETALASLEFPRTVLQ